MWPKWLESITRKSASLPLSRLPSRSATPSTSALTSVGCGAYTEVLGSRIAGQDLGTSQTPMRTLAVVGGVPVLGLLIDIGALVSLFAGTLACITAAARVLLLMAHNGLAHNKLRATHARNETPGHAIAVTGTAALLPVAVLAARGASGLDVYGWMGSLATYGFIVTYALVCLALPRYLRDHGACRPGRGSSPRWLAPPCCWRSWEIFIRCRRDLRQATLYLLGVSDGRSALVSSEQPEQESGTGLKIARRYFAKADLPSRAAPATARRYR